MRPNRNYLPNFIIFFLSLLIFFAVFEITLRLINWREYGFRVNHATEGNVNISHFQEIGYLPFYKIKDGKQSFINLDKIKNGDDFNSVLYHDYQKMRTICESEKDIPKIIFVGDSVLLGFKRNNLIEPQLKQYFSEINMTIDVINFAVGGYNLDQIEELVKNNVLPCKPIAVFYAFCQNDINDNYFVIEGNSSGFGRWTYSKPVFFRFPFENKLNLRIYDFIEYRINNILSKNKIIVGNFNIPEFIRYENNLKLSNKYETLHEMHNLAKENDILFFILIFPYLNSNEYLTLKLPIDYAKKYNVPFINLRENFIQNNISYLDLGEDVEHFSDEGAKIASNLIIDSMKKEIIPIIVEKMKNDTKDN